MRDPRFSWNFNIKFIENRKKFYALSLAVILIGVAAFAFKGFNYGIDFTGGTMIQVDLHKEVPISEIEKTIDGFMEDPSIVYTGENNTQVIIKTIESLLDNIFQKYQSH